MLNQFHSASYPQLFGMMFGQGQNNSNLYDVYPTTVKGHPT